MATVLTPPTLDVPRKVGGTGSGNNGFGGFGGGDGPGGQGRAIPDGAYRTGMWMAFVAVVMLFAAFTSAMVVRKGASTDWARITLPRILYLNTVLLLGSSVTLETSRRYLESGWAARFKSWLYVTVALGLAFIGGQLYAWRELAARGVYLSTNPSSSFFYLLTAAHGLHLLGGIIALFYIVVRATQLATGIKKRVAVEVTALYWHFMDGLWIYLLILLTVRL